MQSMEELACAQNLNSLQGDKLSNFNAGFAKRQVSLAQHYPILQNRLFGVFAWSKF